MPLNLMFQNTVIILDLLLFLAIGGKYSKKRILFCSAAAVLFNMPLMTEDPTFPKLQEAYNKYGKSLNLTQLFKDDPKRFETHR